MSDKKRSAGESFAGNVMKYSVATYLGFAITGLALIVKGLLAPWNPKVEGRGRAGLKNRQDTFFDAPPTRSRLTAPPKNLPPGRGGACPARGQMVARKYRVIRRGGIYAARCNRPGNAIYRANRTGRIYASPTNLPEICIFPNYTLLSGYS